MTTGPSGQVQTVLGPVDPDTLGVTHTHEHLLCDQSCYFSVPEEASERSWIDAKFTMERRGVSLSKFPYFPDLYVLLDERVAIKEALRFKHAGGGTLVDVTNRGIARDPLALTRISRATGLNVVMGGGYYIPPSYPPDFEDVTEDEITEEIVRDITEGVKDTGVKTGVIGELGNLWPASESEAKVLRAAARAQIITGAPILIHPGFHGDSPAQILGILLGAGADPGKIIMGHLGYINRLETIEWLTETGCFMEWDLFGFEDSGLASGSPPPTMAVPAFPIDDRPKLIGGRTVDPFWGFVPFTYPINMSGQTAASIPCGYSSNGMPIGLHIIGPRGSESRVLQAAAAFEQAMPWADKRPGVS